MPVFPGRPRCFVVGERLYVVPTWSRWSVGEAKAVVRRRSPRAPRLRLDVWALTGSVTGGTFLASVAVGVWHVTGVVALTTTWVVGGLVGAALAAGTRRLFLDGGAASGGASGSVLAPDAREDGEVSVVEVPWDVAHAAPGDATADELAVWSVRVARHRQAGATLLAGISPGEPPEREGAEAEEAHERLARVERDLQEAARDYEPVAHLLGLPAPGTGRLSP